MTSSKNDYLTVSTPAGEAFVIRSSVSAIEAVDAVIFDCDGVLIDVSESIQLVHKETARLYFGGLGWANCDDMVEPADVDAFKLAGRFNSDWHCAYSWLLLYLYKSVRIGSTDGSVLKTSAPTIREFTSELKSRGGGLQSAVDTVQAMCSPDEWADIHARWDCDGLQRIFVEVYAGDLCAEVYGFEATTVTGPGLVYKDKPLLDRRFLPSVRLGIATGRTAGEMRVGIRLMGWDDLFPWESVVSEDDGFKKPDPEILRLAEKRIGSKRAIYIGDTPDDLLTVENLNASGSKMLTCAALSGHFQGEAARKRFMEQGIDIIADNVNAALVAIDRCMGGAICQAE